MNDSTAGSEVIKEFSWRRFQEATQPGLSLYNVSVVVLLIVVLLLALFYVMWMYITDSTGRKSGFSALLALLATLAAAVIIAPAYLFALYWGGKFATHLQLWGSLFIAGSGLVLGVGAGFTLAWLVGGSGPGGVGTGWGMLLASLRLSVYTILAVLFLLPAMRNTILTRSESKVVVVWDVSASQQTSDDTPTGRPNEKLTTRMDLVRDFLNDPQANFLPALQKNNPVTVYRFGSKLDEDYLHFSKLDDKGLSRVWTREEKEKAAEGKEDPEPADRPLGQDYWRAWLNPQEKAEGGIGEREEERLAKLQKRNEQILKEGFLRATNIADSLSAVISREMNNRPQGIVVFTDGRNTEGSPNAFRELANRAKAAGVPIFVIAVGEDREKIKLQIVDTRTPPPIQPEDRFPVATEIVGDGLPGRPLDVKLEITHVRTFKDKVKGKDGKMVEQERELLLPIELVERENPEDAKAKREKISLGTKLVLAPQTPVVLDKETPPRATVEWTLHAADLARAAKIDLEDGPYKSKKWGLAESLEDSEYKFRVIVPRDKGEPPAIIDKKDPKLAKNTEEIKLREKFHVGERAGMKVTKKPLRVLLFAGAANRDYQFVQALLSREMDKKQLELAIHLQPPPGQLARPGVVQSVPKERLLHDFPETFRRTKDLTDLASYDVIVAFDPDWNRLSPQQIVLLKNWVEQGGGLVMVGGHINTVELIRPRDDNAEHFKPILDVLPVFLGDRRELAERKADDPFALDLGGATRELEFIKLDEQLDDSKFKEDWQAFFYGTTKESRGAPVRGFYSVYPLVGVKTSAIVVARFTDPDPQLRLKDGTMQPFIVINPDALPRVVWIGSAETWRLREYKEAFHERFWTKLVQYAGAKSKGGTGRAILPNHPKSVPQNRPLPVEARIDAPDGTAAARTIKPEITLKMPVGADPKDVRQPIIMLPHTASKGWFSARFTLKTPGDYEATVRVPRGSQPGQDSDLIETFRFSVTEANPELDNTRPDFNRMYTMASEADLVTRRIDKKHAAALEGSLRRPPKQTTETADAADRVEIREDKKRLYFELKRNAALVPDCMIPDPKTEEIRGPHEDLWDKGVALHLGVWLLLLATLVGLGCQIYLAVLAFQESAVWGLVVLLVPAGFLAFTIVHWRKAWVVFLAIVACWSVQVVGLVMLVAFPQSTTLTMPFAYVLGLVVGLLSIEWLTRKLLRLA